MYKSLWATEYAFTLENLEKLFKGDISYIRIPSFSNEAECALLSSVINEQTFDFYHDFVPAVGKLGITQYDGVIKGKEWYFNQVSESNKLQNLLFKRSFNPLERLFDYLYEACNYDLIIPDELGYGKYFAGVVRDIKQSVRVHADFAVFDAPNWSINNISSQLTWNLYCQLPQYGGECIIYNYLWDIKNDEKLDLNTYQYNLDVLRDCEAKVIKPEIGSLYIFNSRNFHEVTMSSSSRLSVSSFIGKSKASNQLLFWS